MTIDELLRSGRWYLAVRLPDTGYGEPMRLHVKPLDYNAHGVLAGIPNHETGAGGLGYAVVPWEIWGRFYLYPLRAGQSSELDAARGRGEAG